MTQVNNGQVNGQQVNNQVATQKPAKSHSERFTDAVVTEFSSNNGGVVLTPFQKRLCQNYFIKLDLVLKAAEAKRQATNERYRDVTPLTWEHVNMQKLATDVVIFSSVGLDPTQPNHVSPIPYKNKATGKYDITFIPGYRGTELKARKYGLDVPDEVIVELIFEKDEFEPIRKDMNNKVESYIFKQSKNLDRGSVVGGFYYYSYDEKPSKNKLKTFSKADIDKRKPDKASAEFWGGMKDVWENGQKTGQVEIEGWYEEMAYKTIYKAAYNAITIDSEKIDSNYVSLLLKEGEARDLRIADEIRENANKKEMGFQDADVVDTEPRGEEPHTEISSGPGF